MAHPANHRKGRESPSRLAGRACPHDGAAAILVGSAAAGARLGLTPRFRVVARASAGVDPRIMGIGPVPAVTRALERAGWTVADLDAVELNEAFTTQSLTIIQTLNLDESRVNQHGGAIALGHPLGCSGARITARDWAAKASLSSTASRSADRKSVV